MFQKKYIFETRSTKSKRLIRTILVSFILTLISLTLLCLYIPSFAVSQNEITDQALFEKTPDVIAVFTGDVGRIDYAFKKAEKYPSSKVFISGVYAKNSLKTLLHKQGKDISVSDFLDQESHHIELDYLARNTIENVLSTLHYIKKLNNVENVLIISSDYHMLRIAKIVNTLMEQNTNVKFHYESIPGKYDSIRSYKKLFKEVYKLVKAYIFLTLWDPEISTSNS